MIVLAAGVLADLGRKVTCYAHVEHNFLDFPHLFGVCVQLLLRKGTFDLLRDDNHLPALFLQRSEILEGSCDCILIEFLYILLGLNEAHKST
jgi:hypothetical protein